MGSALGVELLDPALAMLAEKGLPDNRPHPALKEIFRANLFEIEPKRDGRPPGVHLGGPFESLLEVRLEVGTSSAPVDVQRRIEDRLEREV